MRKVSIKRDRAYKEGKLITITYVCDVIDELICSSNTRAENAKLWILRDKMRTYQANLREELNNEDYR